MRILLAASASYAPPRGGAHAAIWPGFDRLAAAGTSAASSARLCPIRPVSASRCSRRASRRSTCAADRAIDARLDRSSGRRGTGSRARTLGEEIRAFEPDWFWCRRKTSIHMMLGGAHASAPDRIVFLAHTPQFFPFGPQSWNPDRSGAAAAGAAAIVVIGRTWRATFASTWAGRGGHSPAIYGAALANHARFDAGW